MYHGSREMIACLAFCQRFEPVYLHAFVAVCQRLWASSLPAFGVVNLSEMRGLWPGSRL